MVFIESPLAVLRVVRCYLFVSLLFERILNRPFTATFCQIGLCELN